MTDNNQNIETRLERITNEQSQMKTDIAVTRTLVEAMKDQIAGVKTQLEVLTNRERKSNFNLAELNISKMLIFGAVGVALTAVTTTLGALIIKLMFNDFNFLQ